ncbi:alpha/beta hydrolase [Listeria sp. PSOL-1]|uniref:alpha/beta hydrolase n=1 Tax=Listeria sp. PSOL-1 TaxID=1844999 RepID=UPI0013D10657|nr:alpha/beta hydrolase [Listeria sp. PSOL-1]
MIKKTLTYAKREALDLKADFYRSEKTDARTIIYFHGGGLIYGTRYDLPEEYIQLFLESGYHLLACDYRLAPETKLPQIYQDASDAVFWFKQNARQELGLTNDDFALFGRSSGAFLAINLASDPALPKPFAILSFYGYSSLKSTWVRTENLFFKKYPAISATLCNAMILPHEIAEGAVEKRFALYLYSKQSGEWLSMVAGIPINQKLMDTYSLDPEQDFHFLPPIFLAHSLSDPDVPAVESEKLANGTLYHEFYQVEDLPHDFDTDTTKEEGALAYKAAIRFLGQLKDKDEL